MALRYKDSVTGTTAQRYDVGPHNRFAIQPDVAVYVTVGGSSITATSSNGALVAAGGWYEDTTGNENTNVSVLPVAGTFTAKIFKE